MKLRMTKLLAKKMIILVIIVISSGIDASFFSIEVQGSANDSSSELLTIEKLNLEVKYQNKFRTLNDFIFEAQIAEEQDPRPQLLNKSTIRINTTFSTIIGQSESLIIHEFVVEVYEVTSGNFTLDAALKSYHYNEPIEVFLAPNTSKSEVIIIDSLELPDYGTYKFAFRVQYHIFEGDETPTDYYFPQNETFILVKSYPTPPYIIIYVFVFVVFGLILLITFGIYGSRKYEKSES